MATDNQHDDYLDRLADQHQSRIGAALAALEERIAQYLNGAPDLDGKLFDVEWAVSARSTLQQILEEEYLQEVQSILDGYTDVELRAIEMLNNYGDFTRTNPAIVSQLQRLSFQGFEDIGNAYLDTIANEVYQNALTGRSKADMVKSIRQSINGVYMESDKVEINRLVDIAKNGTPAQAKAAIDKLHSVYAADKVGNNMRRYATQIAQDSLMQFDASINVNAGVEAGAEKWKYYGDVIRDSRSFCREHAGNTYTTEEISDIWSGSWTGKASGDPFIVRGGYNCRHHWRPVFDEADASAPPPPPPPKEEPEAEREAGLPKVESKSKVIKEINKGLESAGKTTSVDRSGSGYLIGADGVLPSRFKVNGKKRGETTRQAMERSIGKASLSTLTPEATALLNKLVAEAADLGKKFKAPPIRGISGISGNAGANMGDGLLGVNQKYFNRKAKIAYNSPEKLRAEYLAGSAKLDELKDSYEKKLAEYNIAAQARKDARGNYDSFSEFSKSEEYLLAQKLGDEVEKLRKAANKQVDIVNDLANAQEFRQVSTWSVGDDLTLRPYTSGGYFDDGIDELRSIVYHEYGHLVHQETWRRFQDRDSTSVERFLASLFYDQNKKRNKSRVFPTKYSEVSPEEWFAESFSLYNMGKSDLIDPTLKDFLDAIVENDGAIKVFNGWNFENGGLES